MDEFVAGSRPCSEDFCHGFGLSLYPQEPALLTSNQTLWNWHSRKTILSMLGPRNSKSIYVFSLVNSDEDRVSSVRTPVALKFN